MIKGIKKYNPLILITVSVGFVISSYSMAGAMTDFHYFENVKENSLIAIAIKADMLMVAIALIILLTTGRNYILSIISSLSKKKKMLIIHKVFGASQSDIIKMALKEGAIQTAIITALTLVIVYASYDFITEYFLYPNTPYFETCVYTMCLILSIPAFIITAVIPAFLYTRITGNEYRSMNEMKVHNPRWQIGILCSQVFFTCILFGMSVLTYFEYKYIENNPWLTQLPATSIKAFGIHISLGCITSIVLTLIGVLAYLKREVEQHTKEIAIRRIYGGSRVQVAYLICSMILKFLIPTYIAGAIVGDYIMVTSFQNVLPIITHNEFIGLISFFVPLLFIVLCIIGHTYFLTSKDSLTDKLKYE